ncbi:MAG TPA: exonuclease domain-containing protein [Methylomirabilota bacterium]
MKLERKLALRILGLFVPPTAVAGLAAVLLHRHGALPEPPRLLAVGLIGLAVTMLYLGVAAHRLGRSLARAVEEIQHGTELMVTVNPEHRLDVRPGEGLHPLTEQINRLAEHLRAARQGLDERVAVVTRELQAEHALLSAILGELADGVVVAGPDGRVTLANRAAGELLSAGGGLLGRDLFDLVDRETIGRHLAALDTSDADAERFSLRTAAGAVLPAAMTALRPTEGRPAAIILALRDPAHALSDAGAAPAADPAGRWRDAPRRLVGAGLHSGVAATTPGPARPELHDFSLFDEIERGVTPVDRERPLAEVGFVVFDTETTGLRPEAGDRVISIAGVHVRGGRVKRHEIFDALVHPGRAIPPESVKFHGITDPMVVGAPTIDVVLPAFLRFARDAVLVGHEASFDLRFLEPELRRMGLPSLTGTRSILDTRLLSRSLHGPGESHSLEAIALRLGVTVAGRHSALGDALTTAEILARLLTLLQSRGVLTLGAALDAVRGARRVIV